MRNLNMSQTQKFIKNMITFLPFAPSACWGWRSTFALFRSIVCMLVWTGNGVLSIFISGKINRPSFMADYTWRRKTLQSLVAWEWELWNLQYARCFNSSSSGITWEILICPKRNNSSNIRSHLEASNVNFISFFWPFWVDFSDAQEHGLAADSQTNSAV